MDDQLSDLNARAGARDDDTWSPSDGLSARRRAIAEARAGIEAGRKRAAERQRAIEERHAQRARITP